MSDVKVMFFCLGNICRSPLAEGLFKAKVRDNGMENRFYVESSGTSSFHVGEAPDPGSQNVARERADIDISDQRSQQLESSHLKEFDYLVAMDKRNMDNALQMASDHSDKVLLLRDFEPEPKQRRSDVPDPYGGGQNQFERVYKILDRCLDEFLEYVRQQEQL
jgi:protein-tyrosine phosphatase